MKIKFESNNRLVQLGRSMEISYADNSHRDRVRYRATRPAVRKALFGLRKREARRITYRDFLYAVMFLPARVVLEPSGAGGFYFGCQYFDPLQANLIRRWAGVPAR